MLYELFNAPGNPDCPAGYDNLLTIIEGIYGNMLTLPSLRPMCDIRGIVLAKPGNTDAAPKGRMLGIAPTFLRLAAAVAQKKALKKLTATDKHAKFGPLQFALMSEAGATAPALIMQALYDGYELTDENVIDASQRPEAPAGGRHAGPTKVLVSADTKYAFYYLHQDAIAKLVAKEFPEFDYALRRQPHRRLL